MKLPIYTGELPYLTTEQMVEVDRLMIEDFKIELMQMMENAGRNPAHLARVRFFDGGSTGKKVAMAAGHWSAPGVCTTTVHRQGYL